MPYRKITANTIFDGRRLLEDHVLVLTEEGVVEALIPLTEAGEGVERFSGTLSPGFVNCHCHLELSHMKGLIPERTGLVDFVFNVVTQRSAPDEEIAEAIAAAEAEMKAAGIVAVGDVCNNALTLPQKQKGNLHYCNFIEASGWLPAVAEARFERAKAILSAFEHPTPNAKRQTPNAIVPHAPYSVSEDLWQRIQPYFKNKVVSVHNQETAFEDEFFLHGTGDVSRMYALMKIDNSHHVPTKRSSLQSYFDKLAGAEKIILVHNTFTKQEDIDFITGNRQPASGNNATQPQTPNPKPTPSPRLRSASQTFFCLCPNANLYIEGALPPVEMLRQNNCNLVLGTDSLASNWSLNVWDEIKTIRKHFPKIGLEEMLRWATLNGAMALGFEADLGSFETGKKPGAVLVSEGLTDVRRLL